MNKINSLAAILKEKTIGTGLFEFLIDPGEYILSINRYGYLEKIEEIVAIQGENNYEIEMKRGEIPVLDPNEGKNPPVPAPDAKKQDPFVPRPPSGKQRYADVKKEPLHTDIPKIKPQEEEEEVYQMEKKIMPSPMNHQDHHPHPEEGAKNNKDKAKSFLHFPYKFLGKVKKVNFRVLNLDTEEPVFGAEIQIDEISLKGSTDHEGKIQIPISKMKEGRIEIQHQHFFGVIEDYGDEGGIDLKSLQDKIFYLIPRTSNDNEIHVRFVPGGSKRCLKLSILAEESKLPLNMS